MLAPFADFLDNFNIPDPVFYTGIAVFVVLIGVFVFMRMRKPSDDE